MKKRNAGQQLQQERMNLGRRKMLAANRIAKAATGAKAADDLRARNAYRTAIGLSPATV